MTKPDWLDVVNTLVENFSNKLNIVCSHKYLYVDSHETYIWYTTNALEDAITETTKKLVVIIDVDQKRPLEFYDELAQLQTNITAVTPTDFEVRVMTKNVYDRIGLSEW